MLFEGFAEAVRALKQIGLLNVEKNILFNPAQGPDLTWVSLSIFNEINNNI
jgi:hypothetical protein